MSTGYTFPLLSSLRYALEPSRVPLLLLLLLLLLQQRQQQHEQQQHPGKRSSDWAIGCSALAATKSALVSCAKYLIVFSHQVRLVAVEIWSTLCMHDRMIVQCPTVPMSHCPLSVVRCPIVIRQLVDDTDTTPFRLGSDRIASHRNWSTPATLESEHHPPTPSTPTLTQSQPERQCRDVLSFIAHADVDGASWGSQVPNCFRLLQPVHSFFSLSLLLLLLLSSFFAAVFFLFCLIDFCDALCGLLATPDLNW